MKSKNNKYIHRDVSWLSFNQRVLDEAKNEKLPIFERILFLSIFSSNLDEFFRVRVAALRSLQKVSKKKIVNQINFNPNKTLKTLLTICLDHQNQFGRILYRSVIPELKKNGIIVYWNKPLLKTHKIDVRHYFMSKIMSYLQPIFISENDRPFFNSNRLYFVLRMVSNHEDGDRFAFLNIPSNALPRFVRLKSIRNNDYFIFIDDIIRENIEVVFPGFKVLECKSIKLNRDADLNIEDEFEGDLVEKIQKHLFRRNIGAPSRFLYDASMSEEMKSFLKKTLELHNDEMLKGGVYHNLSDLSDLSNPKFPELQSVKPVSLRVASLDVEDSLYNSIDKHDVLLHFPYHSYDYVLRFFNEAAIDPFVKEINATIYRVAGNSFIVNALISAAKNGKKVTVFVEVKARFDEANNLNWAKRMEEAGINIIYSIPNLKVHAKVAMVIRHGINGEKKKYGFFSTGNFNESSARIYSDIGLFTSDKELLNDLDRLFKFITKAKPVKKLSALFIAQINLKDSYEKLILREINNVKNGGQGKIKLKLNNLEDQSMIDLIYQAVDSGVKVDLNIRGICCLNPDYSKGKANLRVVRLVDQFLEHARIFYCWNNGKEELYLSSADWMKRNLYHRIEVTFPIKNQDYIDEVKHMLDLQMMDNDKLVRLDGNLNNNYITRGPKQKKVRAQSDFYNYLKKKTK